MIKIKEKLKIFASFLFTIFCALSTYIPAYADDINAQGGDGNILGKFNTDYNNMLSTASESSWSAMHPIITLLIYALVVIGIVLIIGGVVYLVFNILKTITGKGGLTKEVFRNFVIALFVGVLITTSGWLSILKVSQNVVDSGVQIINNASDSGGGSGGGQSSGNTITTQG